eukprot:GILI01029273.1.p1 GENE.GILI01029273.1~~GILI01029273.1.p1  ORF type:complete len:150 (-),score=25.81 GILI01029273.1:81-530(-)
MERLSKREIAECQDVFSMFDKDGDGTIDADELHTVMRSLGQDPSEAEIKQLIETVDLDKNGTIEFEEFCTMMADRQKRIDPEEELHSIFKVIDKNADGFISMEDLKETIKAINWGNDAPPTTRDMQQMLYLLNPDGQLTVEDLRRAVRE